MFTTHVTETEVYLFYNGALIYKKWLHTDQPSKLFDRYGPPRDLTE